MKPRLEWRLYGSNSWQVFVDPLTLEVSEGPSGWRAEVSVAGEIVITEMDQLPSLEAAQLAAEAEARRILRAALAELGEEEPEGAPSGGIDDPTRWPTPD